MSFDDLLPDTVFGGDPEKQFFDILKASDPHAAQNEILSLIDRMNQLELFLETKGLLDEAELFRPESGDRAKLRRDYLIGAMARIVSSHER